MGEDTTLKPDISLATKPDILICYEHAGERELSNHGGHSVSLRSFSV
jgi:hypothetical protein